MSLIPIGSSPNINIESDLLNICNFNFKKVWLTVTIGQGKNSDTYKQWIHHCKEPGHQGIKKKSQTVHEFC